ncbi:uncharacterized protein ACIBXB_022117 [Morphnus guianensis]
MPRRTKRPVSGAVPKDYISRHAVRAAAGGVTLGAVFLPPRAGSRFSAPALPRGFPRDSPPRHDLAQIRVQLTSGYYDSSVSSPPSAASGAAPALRQPRLASVRPRRDPGSPPRRCAALLRPRYCGFAYDSRLFLSSLVACWDPQLFCQVARDVPVSPSPPPEWAGPAARAQNRHQRSPASRLQT